MNAVKNIVAVGTFVGASGACVALSATYPIAIWAVAFAVLQRRKAMQVMMQQQQQHYACPLAQSAATRDKESKVRMRVVD